LPAAGDPWPSGCAKVLRTRGKAFRLPAAAAGRRLSLEPGEGIERVTYRLPVTLAAARGGGVVFVVEGERDADRQVCPSV
jgi:hypothetical protein